MYVRKIILNMIFLETLGWIGVQDYRYHRIPDWCSGLILILGIAAEMDSWSRGREKRIAGALMISLLLFVFALFLPGCVGGGDIKFSFAGGAFLGMQKILRAAGSGFLLAGAYAGYLMLVKKKSRKEKIALGPFLCLGMAAEAIGSVMMYLECFY